MDIKGGMGLGRGVTFAHDESFEARFPFGAGLAGTAGTVPFVSSTTTNFDGLSRK